MYLDSDFEQPQSYETKVYIQVEVEKSLVAKSMTVRKPKSFTV